MHICNCLIFITLRGFGTLVALSWFKYRNMSVKIFTIPFNFDKNRFDTLEVDDFCQNKKINHQQASFFELDGIPYWTIFVNYEVIVTKDNILYNLNKSQKALYIKLKEWRKQKAKLMGLPSFIIAPNVQLEQMITQKCISHSALENIIRLRQEKSGCSCR